MILSDDGIRLALQKGHIVIDPMPQADQYQTSAVDIFLGDKFLVWDLEKLSNTDGFTPHLNLTSQRFVALAAKFTIPLLPNASGLIELPPYRTKQQILLCQTRERIALDPKARLAARVEGRSSLARLGVMVHLTAPTIHAGFSGHITLEVINHGPFTLELVPNETRICQFIFEKLASVPKGQLTTEFKDQDTPIGKSKGGSKKR